MSKIKQLLDILEGCEFSYQLGVEFEDSLWRICPDEKELCYNSDNSIEDLLNGDGDTYSLEVLSCKRVEGYMVVLIDNGCGQQYTIILPEEKEINQ